MTQESKILDVHHKINHAIAICNRMADKGEENIAVSIRFDYTPIIVMNCLPHAKWRIVKDHRRVMVHVKDWGNGR